MHKKKNKKVTKPDAEVKVEPTIYKPCHTGSTVIFTLSGHSLKAGGWSKDVDYGPTDVIIDLTGNEKPDEPAKTIFKTGAFSRFLASVSKTPCYDWLSLHFPDYGVPSLARADWNILAVDIQDILKDHDVVVACQGGHGRTGIFTSIMWKLFVKSDENPVEQIRKNYCAEAVDTAKQEQYIYDILELDFKPDPEHYKTYTGYSWQGAEWEAGAWQGGVYGTSSSPSSGPKGQCPVCGAWDYHAVTTYGLCTKCSEEYEKEIERVATETGQKKEEVILADAATGGKTCRCGSENCFGIIMCTCGHVVHDQMDSYLNKCDDCFNRDKKGQWWTK